MTANVADMVEAIVEEYDQSTADQRSAGTLWYDEAGRIVRGLAKITGRDAATMAAILATLSPRNPWAWNVQDAAAVSLAGRKGGTCPSVTTFNANRDKAWALATGEANWGAVGIKVSNFAWAILGDRRAVVIDVWALRVATRGTEDRVRNEKHYRAVAEAYIEAAKVIGIDPVALQAITWLSAQARGLGSKRRGRHDLTIKAGTFPEVIDLLKGAAS